VPLAWALAACLATATLQVASGSPGIVVFPTLAPWKPLGTLPPLPMAPTLAPWHIRTIPAVTVPNTQLTTTSKRTMPTTAAADTSQQQTTVETTAQRTTTAPVPTHLAVTESTSSASQTEPVQTTVETTVPATTDAPTSTNTTTTLASTSTSTAGCAHLCKVGGPSSQTMATCKSLIQNSAFHDFLGDVDSCPKARDKVLDQCPACEACPLTAAGCGVLEPISTPAPIIHGPPCEARCIFRESKATCGSRIMWASQNSFPGKPDSCNRAYSMVLKQCPICKKCTSRAAGCPTGGYAPAPQQRATTDSDLFDCTQISDFKEKRQTERISWCCKHKHLGCEGKIDVLQRFGGERSHHLQATISSSMRSQAANIFMAGFVSLFGGYMVARRCSQTTATPTPEKSYTELPETRALLE